MVLLLSMLLIPSYNIPYNSENTIILKIVIVYMETMSYYIIKIQSWWAKNHFKIP